MRIVLLSARRLRPHQVESAIADLGFTAADAPDVRIVTWSLPVGRLPVLEHVVVGPDPLSKPRTVRVAQAASAPAQRTSVAMQDDGAGPEEVVDGEPLAAAETDPPSSAITRTGSERIRHAVRWRTNRARMAMGRHPLSQKVLGSTKVRRVAAKVVPGGVSAQFAISAARAQRVRRLCAMATVVVAIDQNAQRAAWLLARRVPHVPFVVGLPAAKRVIEESSGR